ncbi:MAG: sigma-70 family RNA polymerase sigma factor [Bacteroidaceae bacterium]|nr:sigma-70 family RNA polymerase sigma factor [Bacteroidaceae bacterium]
MSKESLIKEYKRLMALLRSGTLRLLGRSVDAEDALHDAFSCLWNNQAAETPPRSLSWEFHHRLARELRKRRRHLHTEVTEDMRITPPPDYVADTFRFVEQIIEEKLSPLQRDILHRREYDQQSILEIANALGMKEPAVRMNLSRARKTIREIYNRIEQCHNTTNI